MEAVQKDMASAQTLSKSVADDILDHKWLLRISAVVGIVLGTVAILMPWVATFAANFVIGAVIAGQGLVDALLAFKARSASRIAGKFLLGLLSIAAGVFLVIFPLLGVLTLTIWLAAYFAASGVMKGYWAFKLRPAPRWGWMLFSSILGIAMAAFVSLGLPETAFWVLGLFVGVDLLFLGCVTLALIPRAKDVAAQQNTKSSSRTSKEMPQGSTESTSPNSTNKGSSAEAFIRQPVATDPPSLPDPKT